MYKYERCCKPFKADLAFLLVLLLCVVLQCVLVVKVLLTRLALDLVHVGHVILKTCHCGKFQVAFCASFSFVHILGVLVEVCKHVVAVAALVRGVHVHGKTSGALARLFTEVAKNFGLPGWSFRGNWICGDSLLGLSLRNVGSGCLDPCWLDCCREGGGQGGCSRPLRLHLGHHLSCCSLDASGGVGSGTGGSNWHCHNLRRELLGRTHKILLKCSHSYPIKDSLAFIQ